MQHGLYVETRLLVFTSKVLEKHLRKSGILSKDAGHRPASLLKMLLFYRCLNRIMLRIVRKNIIL